MAWRWTLDTTIFTICITKYCEQYRRLFLSVIYVNCKS